MTTQRNIPSESKIQELNTGTLPIVITGTLPRDEHTLRLIRQLNALSSAGRVEVFYFPEQDQEDPLQVLVEPEKPRLVNPARVPEDLQVSDSVQGATDRDYYKAVDKKLRAEGTPAVVIAFAEKVAALTSGVDLRYQGTWNDARNNFRAGNLITVQVVHNEQSSFLDHRVTLERVSAANIERLVCLPGPSSRLTVDMESTRKKLVDHMLRADGSKFTEEYIDEAMNHVRNRASSETSGYSTTGDLTRAGLRDSTQKSTSELAETALKIIDEILARDPALTQAVQSAAKTILAAAQEEAQRILDDARFSELETLSRVEEIERETLARLKEVEAETLGAAQARAADLTDAAIEAAHVIPELTEMLKGGPLHAMSLQAAKKLQESRTQEYVESQNKQLAVKTQLDIIVQSYQTIASSKITSWGAGWETQSYRRNAERVLKALRKAKDGTAQGLLGFSSIERLIDTTNLGHEPMGIEDATLAIGLNSFVRETRKLEPYRNLERLASSNDFAHSSLDSWDIDQTQMDRAFMEAMLARCSVEGFSDSDRKFLDTCDHIMAGEISQSLRRSLDGHRMQLSFGEVQAHDPFSVASDTNGLIDEVEAISRQQKAIEDGRHVPGSLQSTLEEVNIAARNSEAARARQTTNQPVQPAQSPQAEAQPMAMRSDGTVVQFPQR